MAARCESKKVKTRNRVVFINAMKILFTGVTSFTGMWFVRKLAEEGHDVMAAVRCPKSAYSGLRSERLEHLGNQCRFAWNVPFGKPEFLNLIAQSGPFDILCHHAAEVRNFKSADFDVAAAVAENTCSLPAVLDELRRGGCGRIVLTGSVFEAGEGAGSTPLRAFSPYGVSKTRTAQIFQDETGRRCLALGKFVIPNPFGPFDGPRFTEYLMQSWKSGHTPKVLTPSYVRDNIPAPLLAAAYARFIVALPQFGFVKFNPSYYVETQGAFARRFAGEIGQRLKIEVPLEFAKQTDFPEPEIRINTDTLRADDFGWSERAFWNDTAGYYANRLNILRA
jgi:UDP-glucose 4-epimerase